jgi:hypothetical protein
MSAAAGYEALFFGRADYQVGLQYGIQWCIHAMYRAFQLDIWHTQSGSQ